MLDAFIKVIRDDPTIYLLVRDRVFDAREVHEISRANTPTAFDVNQELLPCILIKNIAVGRMPRYRGAASIAIQIYFYERFGYQTTEQLRERCKRLLHDTQLTPITVPPTAGCWRVWWDDDLGQIDDEALANAVEVSNYRILKRDFGYD